MTKLADFLPRTLDERLAKLNERLNQAWPTFGRRGDYGFNLLQIKDHEPGTIIRFFADDGLTFHPNGVVRHGSLWFFNEGEFQNGVRNADLQKYLADNKLNWVTVL